MVEGLAGVFMLALVELWAAIPLGFHLNLPPVLFGIVAGLGAFIGAAAAMFFGDGLRRLVFWRKRGSGKESRLSTWLARKGPWAIGLLGPLLIGPTVAGGLAGAAGLPKPVSLALLAGGIVVWTSVIVLLGHLGIAQFGH